MHPNVWRRAAMLLLACIALVLIASSDELHGALLHVLHAIEAMIDSHPVAGALLFVMAAALSATLAFVSVAVAVPAAVLAWGELNSLLLLWLGWIIGGIGAYGIGKFLGRPAVRWLTSEQTLYRVEQRIARDAPLWLVLLLQLALPSEVLGYVLGIMQYSFARYLLALGLAELPYSLATIYLGAGFLEHRSGAMLLAGIAIASMSIAALYVLRRMNHPAPS